MSHPPGLVAVPAVVRRRASPWSWLGLAIVCCGVLGQGERTEVDPRFVSPGSTLTTYWEALRVNDQEAVVACFAEPTEAVPVVGTLWFLPPTRELTVSNPRLVPVEVGRLVASYEVRFQPYGSPDNHGFMMSSELQRLNGGWRIIRAAVGTELPEWRPIPHRVDI